MSSPSSWLPCGGGRIVPSDLSPTAQLLLGAFFAGVVLSLFVSLVSSALSGR